VNPVIFETRRSELRQSRAVREAKKMGNIKSVLLAAAVGAAALAPQAARAAVISLTQTFTFASPLTGPTEGPTSSVNFFNSALGNVTSWTARRQQPLAIVRPPKTKRCTL
jgi:hypothetical protein